MQIPNNYSAALYHLPKEFVRDLATLKPSKSNGALAQAWIALIALIWVSKYYVPENLFWIFYVPIIFLIAGRYGVLLQLIHESSHGLLAHSKKRNLFLARWFCAYPIGIFLDGYIAGHMKHHAWTGTPNDPPADTEKYRIVDFHNPAIFLAFLQDILGFTALSIFFKYKETDDSVHKSEKGSKLKALLQISMVQLVILAAVFHLNIYDYVLLWIIPAISPHMFLMRIRGIAEHGLPKLVGFEVHNGWEGNFLTRSFMTAYRQYKFKPFIWLERLLIGSLNVNHHHEHHLFPIVPFYNLPALHQRIAPQIAHLNPHIYASGYFAAALWSITNPRNSFSTTARLNQPAPQ